MSEQGAPREPEPGPLSGTSIECTDFDDWQTQMRQLDESGYDYTAHSPAYTIEVGALGERRMP